MVVKRFKQKILNEIMTGFENNDLKLCLIQECHYCVKE